MEFLRLLSVQLQNLYLILLPLVYGFVPVDRSMSRRYRLPEAAPDCTGVVVRPYAGP